MKRTTMMVLVTSLVLGTGAWADKAQEQTAAKVAALYHQGVSALKEGDVKLARDSFTAVLRIEPGHGNARFYLLKLKGNESQYAPLVRKKKLTQINIPQVDFQNTSLPEAVEGLDILITKESKGEFAANFVIQDPQGVFDQRPVTLKLGNIPASVALEYILRMANASARYDAHAIVIRPNGGGAAKGPAPAADKEGGTDDPFGK